MSVSPYQDLQHRLHPWFNYTDEEKSVTILNAYKKRVLKSDDLKSFITYNRLQNYSQFLFPVAIYPVFKQTLFKQFYERFALRSPASHFLAFKVVTIGVSWLAWLNFSPFYRKLESEKEILLHTIEGRIGLNIKSLNEILPRYWSSQEVNRQTIELYNQRNSFLAGYLYPTEEAQEPLVDFESFPKNVIPGKHTK